jgi:hypothetical protein
MQCCINAVEISKGLCECVDRPLVNTSTLSAPIVHNHVKSIIGQLLGCTAFKVCAVVAWASVQKDDRLGCWVTEGSEIEHLPVEGKCGEQKAEGKEELFQRDTRIGCKRGAVKSTSAK